LAASFALWLRYKNGHVVLLCFHFYALLKHKIRYPNSYTLLFRRS